MKTARLGLVVLTGLGLWVLLLGASGNELEAIRGYLFAFVWLSSFPLGSLAFLMIHHAAGGRWSAPLVGPARAAAATTPLLFLFFLPLGLTLPSLYPWARPEVVAHEALWQHRSFYMNSTGFWLRSLGAILIWSLLAWKMQARMSTPKIQGIASAGLMAHLVLTAVVSVDWVMSLELHFTSTIFGLLIMLLQAVTAYSALALLACMRRKRAITLFGPGAFYDIGGLLLAQVMLVGYLGFSQLVIIWSGNLPHEISWMTSRVWGGWMPWAAGLLICQLFLPFLVLLWGPMKENPGRLAAIAGAILLLSPIHFFWIVMPSFHPESAVFFWGYPAAVLVLGGGWGVVFVTFLSRMKEGEG